MFGFEYYGSEGYVPVETNLAKSVLEEYVTFPVLLSEHDFVEVILTPGFYKHSLISNQVQ